MKRALLIVGAVVGGLILLVAGFIVIGSVVNQIQTAPMVKIADRVQPEPGWTKFSETVVGGPPCTDMPCYSMQRTYNTPTNLTETDLEGVARKSGLSLTADGPCQRRSGNNGLQTLCTASGESDGYDVHLRVVSDNDSGPGFLIIELQKRP